MIQTQVLTESENQEELSKLIEAFNKVQINDNVIYLMVKNILSIKIYKD